jgi:threonine synthase
MWKWRELLPHDGAPVSLGEPETPLIPLPNTGGSNLLVKDEGRLPTGSFKARGLAMAVTMAKQFGIERIAMPTNGNAGAALAAYGGRAGIETIVICPAETPEINVTETATYGARVYVADGQIDECGALVGKGAAEGLWFDCSTLKEPYRLEGKKVMGFELAEQLGWELPDAIFYPTGGGTGLIGMWKAFDELEAVGLIGPERPRMYAVQAEGCAPIVRAFESGDEFAERWEDAATIATGIRVPKAVGDFLILRAVRDSGGAAIAVSEEAILQAVEDAARDDGFLFCPEGGAVLAAWRKALAQGQVSPDERALLFNCANGNKYPLADRSKRLKLEGADARNL